MALADIEKGIAKRFSLPWLKRIFAHPFTPIIVTWLISCIYLLYAHYDGLITSLNDTDDALRLVELRRFLDGAGWYDMRIPRMNPPEGLVSHWSRLIDAGLAGLYLFLSLFLSPEQALLWTRAIWPLLMLLPAIIGIFLIVRRFVGRAIDKELAILLFLASILLFQFYPSRVDHHNAQAALLILSWGFVLWMDRWPFAAWASGFFIAMDLAIGLEIAPFAVAATAIVVLGYIIDPARFSLPLRRHALALAASTALFLSLAVPPARWFETACDTLAPNIAFPLMTTAFALALLTFFPNAMKKWWGRFIGAGISGLAGLVLFVLMDPSCLKGPFAHVDPTAKAVWLDNVKEMQPLYEDPWENITLITLYFIWPVAILFIAFRTWRPRLIKRDFLRWSLVSMAILGILIALSALRMGPYALIFSLPLAGISMAFMPKVKKHPALVLGISPLAMLLLVALATGNVKNSENNAMNNRTDLNKERSCLEIAAIKSLNDVPQGLILTQPDFGPAILALTPHSVVSGPYHRIGKAIIKTFRMTMADSDKAYAMLLKNNIDYVLLCDYNSTGMSQLSQISTIKKNALWIRLSKGDVPAWLKPVPLKGEDNPLRLYRVVKRHAAQKGSGASLAQKPPALRQGLH